MKSNLINFAVLVARLLLFQIVLVLDVEASNAEQDGKRVDELYQYATGPKEEPPFRKLPQLFDQNTTS